MAAGQDIGDTQAAGTAGAAGLVAGGYQCFQPPPIDPAIHGDAADPAPPSLRVAAAATGDADLAYLDSLDPDEALRQFSDDELAALGRFVPSLLCGEESAVLIFAHESKRLGRQARKAMQATLHGLAGEEERHEIMLRAISDWLPDSGDRAETRDRARRFFFSFASSDPALRLAHIAEIDSCVSITLGAMAKASKVARSEAFSRVVGRIRKDEARHVKICRRLLGEIGLEDAEQAAAGDRVRGRFVELMTPMASAFETIGLDSDRLFRRITRETVG